MFGVMGDELPYRAVREVSCDFRHFQKFSRHQKHHKAAERVERHEPGWGRIGRDRGHDPVRGWNPYCIIESESRATVKCSGKTLILNPKTSGNRKKLCDSRNPATRPARRPHVMGAASGTRG